ncbi:MAG: ArnT family glycosyltransferase [Candidatus Glassbacteria bacterium]
MERKNYIYILVLIVLAGLAVRLYELNEPWIGLKDFTGALHGQIAKNYLRFGYLGTGLGPVTNFESEPESFSYYFHHPILFNIVLSIPMQVLGSEEWVLRLVPAIASTAGIGLIFFLVRPLWGFNAALFSSLFLAFVPMDGFFGRMVNEETLAVPIIIAVLILWTKRSSYDKPSMGLAFYTLLLIGLFTAWPLFYLTGFLFVHSLLNMKVNPRRLKHCLILPAMALLSFAAFLLHGRFLTGNWGQSLIALFLERVGAEQALMRKASLSNVIAGRFLYFFTPILLILSLAFLFRTVSKRGQNPPGSMAIIIILYLVAITHIFLFREGALHHEYWLYYFSVPLAISSALGLDYILAMIRKDLPKKLLLAAVCVMFISLSLWRISSLHAIKKFEYVPELGEWLEENTEEHDEILVIGPALSKFGYSETHFDYHPGKIHTWPMPHVGFYSHRRIRWGIRDMDELEAIMREPGSLKYAVMTEEYMDSLVKEACERLKSHGCEVVPNMWEDGKPTPVRIFELGTDIPGKPIPRGGQR